MTGTSTHCYLLTLLRDPSSYMSFLPRDMFVCMLLPYIPNDQRNVPIGSVRKNHPYRVTTHENRSGHGLVYRLPSGQFGIADEVYATTVDGDCRHLLLDHTPRVQSSLCNDIDNRRILNCSVNAETCSVDVIYSSEIPTVPKSMKIPTHAELCGRPADARRSIECNRWFVDPLGNYHFELSYAWCNNVRRFVYSFDRTGHPLGYFELAGAFCAWTIDAAGLALDQTAGFLRVVEPGGNVIDRIRIPRTFVNVILVLSNGVIVLVAERQIHLLTPEP